MFKKRDATLGSKRKSRPILSLTEDPSVDDTKEEKTTDFSLPTKRQKKGLAAAELMRPTSPKG